MGLLDPEATDSGQAFCMLPQDDVFPLAHFVTATMVFSVLDIVVTDYLKITMVLILLVVGLF